MQQFLNLLASDNCKIVLKMYFINLQRFLLFFTIITMVLSVQAQTTNPLFDFNCLPQVQCVQQAITEGADVNDKDLWTEVTPLHIASKYGFDAVAEVLLDAGADVNARDRWRGVTPLHLATSQGFEVTVQVLLNAGADVDAIEREGGWTSLHIASSYGFGAIVQALLDAGADVDVIDQKGRMPLDFAFNTDPSVAEMLIRAGANVDAPNIYGWRPIHHVTMSGDISLGQFLLNQNVNVNAPTEDGWKPIELAILRGELMRSVDMLVFLLDHGAGVPETGTFMHAKMIKLLKNRRIRDISLD